MKKKVHILSMAALLLGATAAQVFAQTPRGGVGIGTEQPDPSAALEIQSKEQGFLLPRMSLQQKNSIKNPANGLMVYQTDMLSGIYVYNGKDWAPLTLNEAKAVAFDPDNWGLTGNAGTNSNINFIGTTDATDLSFRLNNRPHGRLALTTKSVFLGDLSGRFSTGAENVGIGAGTLRANTSGSRNVAIGASALLNNTTGINNFALGYATLLDNTTGRNNIAIGNFSLRTLNGSLAGQSQNNISIGFNALYSLTTQNSNTALGFQSGYFNTGSASVFIGNEAGFNEVSSNKLYIANSRTTTPLIYGDFSAKFISIGDVPVAKRDAIASAGQYGLLVKGGIMTEKIKVALASSTDWADYVFEPTYQQSMPSLQEVEQFILEHKHLPNVPSAQEMADNGLDVTQTVAKLMEKIEELTLYAIEMDKQIKQLQTEKEELKKKAKKRK